MDTTVACDFKKLLNDKRKEYAEKANPMRLRDLSARTIEGEVAVRLEVETQQNVAKVLTAIDRALERIQQGSFGVCNDCGELISETRLKAIPWTRVCISCKEKQPKQITRDSASFAPPPGRRSQNFRNCYRT